MGSSPAGRAIFQKAWNAKPNALNCCGTLVEPLIHSSLRPRDNSRVWRAEPSPPPLLWDFVGPQSPDPRVRYRRVTPYAYRSGRAADSPASAGVQHQHSHNGQPSNDWRGQEVLRDLRRKRPPLANGTRTSVAGHGREPTAIPRHVGRTANLCCSFCQYAGRETGRPRSDEAIAVLLQLTRRCRSE